MEPATTHNGMALAVQTIQELYSKYQSDPYMLSKTHNYICFQLPTILENMKKTYEERQQRNDELSNEQDSFIKTFLSENHYFYAPSTERYFFYDGLSYYARNEDDILHHVLTTISKEKQILMPRKPQTKVYIMKRIKENHILKSVPESETIQCVLDALYPAIFETKADAKYFLCVLGDNMLKKNNQLIHFMDPNAKPFLREITNVAQYLIGANPSSSIKYKYYEHEYKYCRFIRVNEVAVHNESSWMSMLKTYTLDLLCVAGHYSDRYNSSDEYLEKMCNEQGLVNHALCLKSKTPADMVDWFLTEYILVVQPGTTLTSPSISWKNMQYLWKRFLDERRLPTIMFQQKLKGVVCEKIHTYSGETDSFQNVSSKYLPVIQNFLAFWEETIVIEREHNVLAEYEIDELWILYKNWSSNISLLNEKEMIDLISYFFPGVEIEQNKYITGVRCVLWDKQLDIQTAIDQLIENEKTKMPTSPTGILRISSSSGSLQDLCRIRRKISVYDAYIWYSNMATESKKMLVSKLYFEKYICETMGDRVQDKFIIVE